MKRWLAKVGIIVLLATPAAHADRAPPPPTDLDARVGFDQNLGARVPAGLHFRDAKGRDVTLAEIADGRPLLLSLGYYRCPNLCDLVLNGLAVAAGKLRLRPGKDYEIAFVSIDPREQPADAAAASARLAQRHPQADVARWHLLTGDEAAIGALAEAVGFRYFYDQRIDQYAHAAGAVLLTAGTKSGAPQVAQYFFGVDFPPTSLRLALVAASRGKLGSLIDQLVLLCCGYDPTTGRYSLLIGKVMRFVGIGFVLLLVAWIAWVRGKARVAT